MVLTATAQDRTWASMAVCKDCEPDALFVRGAAQRSARMVCFQCPVRLECLADALDANCSFGVWGGLTERERRALLRKYPEITNWREQIMEKDDELGIELRSPHPPRIGHIGVR